MSSENLELEREMRRYSHSDRNRVILNFLNSIFRYLESRIGPYCLDEEEMQLNPDCHQIPNPIYQELFQTSLDVKTRELLDQLISQIVDTYVFNPNLNEGALMAADKIIYYIKLIAGEETTLYREFYDVFIPNRYSGRPVLLAYHLGFLPDALSSVGFYIPRKEPHKLYSNEWKTLLENGFNICESLGVTNFLTSLILSLEMIGGPEDADPRSYENIYTSDELLQILLLYTNCPKTWKAVQDHLVQIDRKIEKLIDSRQLINPIKLDAMLILANNIRSALREYLTHKQLNPGIIHRLKKLPQILKKSDMRAIQLKEDLQGYHGIDGVHRAERLSLEDLLRIGYSVGINRNVFPIEFIRDIEKKLRDILRQIEKEKKTEQLISWTQFFDLPLDSMKTVFDYRNVLRNRINDIISYLYEYSLLELIDISNYLGLSDIPTDLNELRQRIISTVS